MHLIRYAYVLSCSVLVAACGGSPPKAQDANSETSRPKRDYDPTSQIGATAEVGALPEEETQYAMKESFDGIRRCFVTGSRRIEFLGGEIALNVTVGAQGHVKGVFAERSTLGDRETEKCMFDAVKHTSWPKPVGGPIGIAQAAFDFEMSGDVRPPVSWEPDRISQALSRESSTLAACKSDPSVNYQATVYVGTDGRVLAAGVSAPSHNAEEASDCLVQALLGVSFPEPGSWPAKVSFSI